MKTRIYFAAFAAALALTACDSDWTPAIDGGRTGKLDPASLDVQVDDTEILLSKGAGEYNLADFTVKIYPKDSDTPVRTWKYSQTPEIFSLPVGDYRVDVVSHEVKKAEWSAPLYTGSATFNIADSEITDIGTVQCTFKSIRVSVRFTDELRAAMGDDVSVSVVCNNEGRLDFTPDETRSGYFEAIEGSSTLAARFTGTVKGYAEDVHRVYTDVAAGQHRIITFGLRDSQQEPDPETGMIDPEQGVNVSIDVDTEDVNGSVDGSESNLGNEDRPGKEEFDDPDQPDQPDQPGDDTESKITITGQLDLSQRHVLTDETAAKAIVDITSKYGITSLMVTISTANQGFMDLLAPMQLDKPFDLMDPGAAESTLQQLGLLNGVTPGAKEIHFNVSGLVGLLGTFNDSDFDFKLTATDEKGVSESATLMYHVN